MTNILCHTFLASLAVAGACWISPIAAAAGRRPSIMVFYAWSFSNIGDIAITPGMLRLLERYVPEADVTLVCNGPVDKYSEYLKDRFPRCRVLANPFRDAKPTPAEFRQAFDRADLILYNSGTTLSFGRWDRNWNRTIPLALPLLLAHDAGKAYGIYCQTFDRFAPPSDLLFKKVLADAAFIFARDGDSIAYLKSIGLAPPGLEFGPDSTFAFDLRDEGWADKFLVAQQLKPQQFITLTIRTSIQGFIDAKREQAHAAKLRQLVVRWVEQTGMPVLVCPEVDLEIEPARRLIVDPLPESVKAKIRFKPDFWLPDQAFSVYSRARVIVSMEMHSIILGLAAGVPVVHPRFVEAGRKAWMLRDLGVPEWLSDIDRDPEKHITATLLEIDRHYDVARAKVQRGMRIVHQRQAETMRVVRDTAQAAAERHQPSDAPAQ
jgi:polysaccharide pyruvyl transferase WcaK-like protein